MDNFYPTVPGGPTNPPTTASPTTTDTGTSAVSVYTLVGFMHKNLMNLWLLAINLN